MNITPQSSTDKQEKTPTTRNGIKDVEGSTTRAIEQQTSKVPSLGYLGLAIGSMALSAGLILTRKKQLANFVGLWAPSLLTIGLYNKLVKIEKEIGATPAH